jgi:hypothetical protein
LAIDALVAVSQQKTGAYGITIQRRLYVLLR